MTIPRSPPAPPPDNDRLSEGVLLAALPVAAYMAAYALEIGVANAFGFPRSFIELGVRDLMVGAVYLIPLAALIVLSAATAPTIVNTLVPRVAPLVAYVYFSFRHPLPRALAWTVGLTAGLLLTVSTVLFVARDVIRHRKAVAASEKKGLDRLWVDQHWEIDSVAAQRFGVSPRAGARYGFALITLMFVAALMPEVGFAVARMQVRFLTRSSSPSTVVVRRYGNFFVEAEVNRQAHTITSTYRLVPVGDPADSSFRYDDVGPLRTNERQ